MVLHPQLSRLERQFQSAVLTPIQDDFLTEKQLELFLKRDDLLHPVISGNKWRKLKYSLNHALYLQKDTLISMGGAYSNHLHALAFAGKLLNLNTKAFIRGERPAILNPTLQDLTDWNMQFQFISRSDYRELRNFKHYAALPELKSNEYWIPEGGALTFALQGVAESVTEINGDYDVICAACGTGTTLAGIIQAVAAQKQVLGFSALKGGDFLVNDINALLASANSPLNLTAQNWRINTDYHFGGFAKTTPQLLNFIAAFEQRHGIALEPVYTGKMLFGLYALIQRGYFPPGQKIIALHSGGLQGKRSA
jgi:1-aminocyclopropane-1-carboxylate deaminase